MNWPSAAGDSLPSRRRPQAPEMPTGPVCPRRSFGRPPFPISLSQRRCCEIETGVNRMKRNRTAFGVAYLAVALISALVLHGRQAGAGAGPDPTPAARAITEADCTSAKLGSEIPASAIGEPVSAVTLNAPQWHAESNGTPAYCSVEGSLAPVDKNAPPIRFGVALPASWWFRGAQLGGGGMNGTIPRLTGGVGRGGPTLLQQGFATYGSDSGHQMGGFGMPGGGMRMPGGAARGGEPGQAPPGTPGQGQQGALGAARGPGASPAGPGPGGGMPAGFGAPDPAADRWAMNDEAVANFG